MLRYFSIKMVGRKGQNGYNSFNMNNSAGSTTLRKVNTIPYLTWNWLKMNGASVEVQNDIKTVTETFSEKDKFKVIELNYSDGEKLCHEQNVTVAPESELTLIMNYTSDRKSQGFSEIRTKVHVQKNAKLHLVKVQLLGQGFTQIDDTQITCDEGAFADFTQIELGGAQIYANLQTQLSGERSKFNSDTAYIAAKNQLLDMNYESVHTAPHTDTTMTVKGTVADNALKTYRGTIDFKNGCAGATGDEQEETLLLGEKAVNKSIPMILCGEEDVSGTHGATLGRLGAEELFYFQSRGVSEADAQKIMTKAKVLAVANLINDEATVQKISDFLEN